MRKFLLVILGAVSICCFFSIPVLASSKKHGKKGSKTRSTTECVTRATAFTPAYATMVYSGDSTGSFTSATTITFPFSSIQTARNITLDTTANTFTLPKGVYSINFQFVVKTENSGGDTLVNNVTNFKFTKMYLDLNNGSSQVALDWALGHDGSQTMMTAGDNSTWASVSGSKIFSVGADNTVVKIIVERETPSSSNHGIQFRSELDFYSSTIPENNAIRVSLHKIDGCA